MRRLWRRSRRPSVWAVSRRCARHASNPHVRALNAECAIVVMGSARGGAQEAASVWIRSAARAHGDSLRVLRPFFCRSGIAPAPTVSLASAPIQPPLTHSASCVRAAAGAGARRADPAPDHGRRAAVGRCAAPQPRSPATHTSTLWTHRVAADRGIRESGRWGGQEFACCKQNLGALCFLVVQSLLQQRQLASFATPGERLAWCLLNLLFALAPSQPPRPPSRCTRRSSQSRSKRLSRK